MVELVDLRTNGVGDGRTHATAVHRENDVRDSLPLLGGAAREQGGRVRGGIGIHAHALHVLQQPNGNLPLPLAARAADGPDVGHERGKNVVLAHQIQDLESLKI